MIGRDDIEVVDICTHAADWWPLGHGVGYGSSFVSQVADLLEGWPGQAWSPGFGEGAAVQAVCDAMETSAAQDRWVAVSAITATSTRLTSRP